MLLEAGTASGREPAATVEINSYLGRFLSNAGVRRGAEDEALLPMRLLHFRRTFVEKLLAIQGKVEPLKRDGQPLVTYSRHYYDLFQLAERPELSAMLRSDEYAAINEDYDRISREHFPRSYFHPDRMRFSLRSPPREAAKGPPAEPGSQREGDERRLGGGNGQEKAPAIPSSPTRFNASG